jgi:hypothetical protein
MVNHIRRPLLCNPFEPFNHSTTPCGNVQSHSHNDSTDQTSTWESQDPAEENLAQLLPVDTPEIHVGQPNAQHGAGNTLRS